MKRLIVIPVAACLLLLSCSKEVVPPIAIINQLEHNGAVMPVHIHGNRESRSALIVVHGGPGGSAVLQREATGFYRLESDHLVAYYDQRGSGISEGNVSAASLSVEQMAEDLRAVVELVVAGTDAESIFIISLDWGAAVATRYLISTDVHPGVRGYVAVAPIFNGPAVMERSREELVTIAGELLDDGDLQNDAPARNILAFYENNPVIDRFNYEEHFRLLETVGGIVINIDHNVSGVIPPEFVQSQLDDNRAFLLRHWTFDNSHFLESLDVEQDAGAINIPVKLIWGVFDRLVPVSLSREYEALLGPASSEELLSVFPASAHRPYLEEGDRFYATVSTWIDFFD
jgi:pimeloyl-ACP methyl ester carboxylesterase